MDNTPETWMPLVGFEDCYEVSDLGRVARTSTWGGRPKWEIIAERIHRSGYVKFHLCKNGVRTDPLGHRLVWITFRGEIPKGLELNHVNSIRNDNRLINLELMTRSQNCAYSFSHNNRKNFNVTQRGSQQGCSKLVEADIPVIRQARVNGETYVAIAKRYGVVPEVIGLICRRQSWTHVP